MKKTLSVLVIMILAVFAVSAQPANKMLNPVGTWKFEAPYAPEGYTTGSITIGIQDKSHTASVSFTGTEYKIPGEQVKVEGDSVKFAVYLEGATINILMKMESDTVMTGKALTPDGEVPFTLKREPVKK